MSIDYDIHAAMEKEMTQQSAQNPAVEMMAAERQKAESALSALEFVLIGHNTILVTDTGMGLTVTAGRWQPVPVYLAPHFEPDTAARLAADLQRQGLPVQVMHIHDALRKFIADCHRIERTLAALT